MNMVYARVGQILSRRGALGFMLVLAALVGIAAFGNLGIERANASLHQVVDVNVKEMSLVQDMSGAVHDVVRLMGMVVILDDNATIKPEIKEIAEARQRYDLAAEKLRALPLSAQEVAMLDKLAVQAQSARLLNDRVIALGVAQRDAEAAQLLVTRAGPATARWQAGLREFGALQMAGNLREVDQANAAADRTRLWMLGLSAAAVLSGAAIGWRLSRTLDTPDVEEQAEPAAASLAQLRAVEEPALPVRVQAHHASSQKVSDVIGVIDGIAYQTNILALNAAVDVARTAGPRSGLADVASEVRDLAQRSAQAARDLQSLIDVPGDGSAASAETGGMQMADVLASVQRMTALIEGGAAASAPTAPVAAVTPVAQATDALQEQAARLNQVVRLFRMGQGGRAATKGGALKLVPSDGASLRVQS